MIADLEARDLFTRTFSLRARTIDEDHRSVEAAIATEAPVRVWDWHRGEMVHEILLMDGVDLPDSRQVPLLDSHNRWSIDSQLGSTRNLRVDGDSLIGENTFAGTPAGDAAFALVREGHLTDNSVGYRVHASVIIEPGESEEINGRTFTAKELPLKVSTRWSPHENSVCAIGADAAAKNRADTPPATTPRQADTRKDRDMGFNEWLQARGLDPEALTDEQRTALRADYDAEQVRNAAGDNETPPAGPPDPEPLRIPPEDLDAAMDRAVDRRAEREAAQRRGRITELAEMAGVDDETRDAVLADTAVTVAAARERFVERMRDQRPGVPAAHVAPSAADADRRTVEAALLIRGGHGEAAAARDEYSDPVMDHGHRLRGVTMEDLCRHALRLAGQAVPIGREEMIRAAISTGSFSEITSNVAGVSALQGALSVAQTWRAWCSTGSVSNFQANKMVRLDIAGNLQTVGADGKLQHINLEDTGESITAETKGNILTVTRKTIRDDRIGILTKAPMELGKGAIQTISQTVYTLLLANGNMGDGNAIFDATNRGNLNTSTTLDPVGIATAAASLAAMTNAKGQPRDLIPAVLLVPPDQYNDAWSCVSQPAIIAAGLASTSAASYSPAVHAYGDGSIKPVQESRLSNANYTGYSATSWYLMAAPSQCDNVRVDFLDGVQTPTVRQVSPGPGVLGVAFEVFIDYGVAAADGQGMILNQE